MTPTDFAFWAVAACAIISAGIFLALLCISWTRPGETTDREWEECLLVYAGGGPRAAKFPEGRDLEDRSLNVLALAEEFTAQGVFPDDVTGRDTLRAAAQRLVERRAAARPMPEDKAQLPPDGIIVLTPSGAKEARIVWERERRK